MSFSGSPALGGPLGDALAGAEPAAAQQLQQLAAPAADAASKAAALQSQAEEAAGAQAQQAIAQAQAAAAQGQQQAQLCCSRPGTPGVTACCLCSASSMVQQWSERRPPSSAVV